jgi:hypothetical protein
MTKTQIKTLADFLAGGYCRPSSEWTNGSGRYITRKQPPLFCVRMELKQACALPGAAGDAARKLKRDRPRVYKCVVCVDVRAALRTLRSAGYEMKMRLVA